MWDQIHSFLVSKSELTKNARARLFRNSLKNTINQTASTDLSHHTQQPIDPTLYDSINEPNLIPYTRSLLYTTSLLETIQDQPQAVKCLMLRINPGLPSLTAARATASIAVKLRQAWMATCSRPLSLRQPSRSHSFARLNSLSTSP